MVYFKKPPNPAIQRTFVAIENTPMKEEPIVKTRKTLSRIPKQAKTKENRLKSIEATLLAHPMSEAAGKQAATKPRSTEGQADEALLPTERTTIIQAKRMWGLATRYSFAVRVTDCWDKGLPLSCIDGSAWVWSTRQVKGKVVFKLLLNDQVWAKGEDVVVEAGRKIEVVPVF